MPRLFTYRQAVQSTIASTVLYSSLWVYLTRKSEFIPLEATDPIFRSSSYLHNNPNKNPATQDLCIRKVPLAKIKPQLLEKEREGKLVEEFCKGVWGGWGMLILNS